MHIVSLSPIETKKVVSHIRAIHHMCGTLSGTLPQIPQQNVFLGLPVELMVEEAALLVEKGAGYIVDDAVAHRTGLQSMTGSTKAAFLEQRANAGRADAEKHRLAAEERKERYRRDREETPAAVVDDDALFESNPSLPPEQQSPHQQQLLFYPIATTSSSAFYCLPTEAPTSAIHIPTPNLRSYPLYKYLHSRGYFLSPGLRFGCQFMAYPGDPLRFHSHFVARGLGWDEEIDLVDLVGGGRLGTGVKKAWMFGGNRPAKENEHVGGHGDREGETRVFCVEWGGF
jgi:tRNA-splicing endonuclease subunit Sen34